jgi:small GTP-binding protein
MGKLYKILVAGKKGTGKTLLLEQLIYNRQSEKYFPTIEDIYVSYWEKDKNIKEKFRFYDTKGMENANDIETIDTYRYLFTMIDACIFLHSSNDIDSYKCIERIKSEIDKEKIKEKSKEIINFIAIDYDISFVINKTAALAESQQKTQFQQIKNVINFEISYERREQLLKAFSDLAIFMTQIGTKSSMAMVSMKKTSKVFSSKFQ